MISVAYIFSKAVNTKNINAVSAPMITLSQSKLGHASHGFSDPEIETPRQSYKEIGKYAS
jgi:hypothetical protein